MPYPTGLTFNILRFDILLSSSYRLPILKEVPIEMLMNTPDAFTPDGQWVIGKKRVLSTKEELVHARYTLYEFVY